MKVTGRQLAEAIAAQLADIADCRVHSFSPDTFAPPGIIVQMPSMTWATSERTFSNIQWSFPLLVVTPRPNDKTPHDELDRLVLAIAARLGEDPSLGGVAHYSQLTDASPVPVNVAGTDLPGYTLNLEVLA